MSGSHCFPLFLLVIEPLFAFSQQAVPDPPKPVGLAPLPPRQDGKVRVFVGESEMFYSSGFSTAAVSGSANSKAASVFGSGFGLSSAGIRKFTITVMKSVNDTCPEKVVIVSSPDLADYFLRMDYEGVLILHAKMVAFNRSGEMSFIASERKIDKDVKGFCASLFGGPTSPIKKAKKH